MMFVPRLVLQTPREQKGFSVLNLLIVQTILGSMGDKKALISRHIILPPDMVGCQRVPCSGVILIQGQSIAEVRLVAPDVTVSSK